MEIAGIPDLVEVWELGAREHGGMLFISSFTIPCCGANEGGNTGDKTATAGTVALIGSFRM